MKVPVLLLFPSQVAFEQFLTMLHPESPEDLLISENQPASLRFWWGQSEVHTGHLVLKRFLGYSNVQHTLKAGGQN